MNNPNGKTEPDNTNGTGATYTVEPETVEGCECEDCRAGRHVYSLYEWTETGWRWAAISLKLYSSAEECKRKHLWGIDFGPNAVWEDGQPVVEPEPMEKHHKQDSGVVKMVPLDMKALRKSFEALEKHWGRIRR
jgi:hypothetical protein